MRELLDRLIADMGILALGGLVGALWRGLSRPKQSLLLVVLEGIAAIGSAVVFGALFVGVIKSAFSVDDLKAALATGAVCAFFGDKVFRTVAHKILGDDDVIGRQ